MKSKTCKSCGVKFAPTKPLQSVCSTACAINLAERKAHEAKKKAAAEDRRITRAALVKLKTRATLVREAQTAFNAWVRARDAHESCVSCGRMHEGQWHAGHYRSAGSRPDLRFDPANVHKQCAPCNTHLSGNLIPYRVTLLSRIGQAGVDRLEGRVGQQEVDRLEGPATQDKLSRDQLIALRAEYATKTRKALEAE